MHKNTRPRYNNICVYSSIILTAYMQLRITSMFYPCSEFQAYFLFNLHEAKLLILQVIAHVICKSNIQRRQVNGSATAW